MEWIILFAGSWILFFLLKGWKKILTNMWCGFAAIIMQMLIDTMAMQKELYEVKNPVLGLWGSSAFFCFGPVFVIAVLLAAYHPVKAKLVIMNALILSSLYSVQEYLLMSRKVLVYQNWYLGESILVNVIVIISLSWISFFILGKGRVQN